MMWKMKTFYIEKLDKHRFNLYKMKIEKDNFKIYANLEKERNIKVKVVQLHQEQ